VSVVGELLAGRYELEELSGSGGMSRVYRARDRQLGRLVAIKVLHERYADDPVYVERFRREAQAVARLSHPNIVTIIDRGESDGSQYIVFEHVEGEDLKQLVTRVGPLPVRRALDLAIDVARALAFAHSNGVVHRDVKPQNVLLRDGGAKVTDFGIARADDLDLGDTETGTVLGTGDYISPEQARGERATELSDVYSLGVLVYELLTGHVPYPADTAVAAAARHVTDSVPDVLADRPDVPLRLAAAVETAMAKDPAARFPSMDAFLAELVACRNQLPAPDTAQTMLLSAAPPPAVSSTQELPVRRRSRWPLVALLALVLLGVAGGAAYLVYSHGKTASSTGGSPPPAPASTVRLTATSAYDPPPGDGVEGNPSLQNATDGSTSTAWETERYTTAAFGNLKKGVGIVVSTGANPVKLDSLTVASPTPGFQAEIKAGDSEQGPFDSVSSIQTVGSKTTFALHVPEARRFYVVWITQLVSFDTGDASKHYAARISEITGS
jgi:eukaryotic-like serine/threonine-protein kinase